MKKKERRTFTDEFKQEAVRLAQSSGKPKAQVARELGISDGMLHGWMAKQEHTDPKGITLEAVNQANQRLTRELKQAKLEVEILKKAAAYFAKESQ